MANLLRNLNPLKMYSNSPLLSHLFAEGMKIERKDLALLLQIQHLFRGLSMPITSSRVFTHSLPLNPAAERGRATPVLREGTGRLASPTSHSSVSAGVEFVPPGTSSPTSLLSPLKCSVVRMDSKKTPSSLLV